jgi:hypothetical protein
MEIISRKEAKAATTNQQIAAGRRDQNKSETSNEHGAKAI